MKTAKLWTMKQALACLIGSTLFTFCLSLGGFCQWKCQQKKWAKDPRFKISAIIQTGPEKEALKTAYLAELLGLSSDQPQSLYGFNLRKAQEKLLACPLIEKAEVKAIFPSTLYIDYEVRKPVAWLADYHNLAMDRKGYLFPILPFLTPKELPEIYLGVPSFGAPADRFGRKGGLWQRPLDSPHLHLAFDLLRYLEESKEEIRIQRIDVSNAFSESLGTREVVLFTEEELLVKKGEKEFVCRFPKIVRLSPKDFKRQLNHFFSLRRSMLEEYRRQLLTANEIGKFSPRIVDMRIPQLAFVENSPASIAK